MTFRSRRCRRALCWLALVAFVPALYACTARTLDRPVLVPDEGYEKTFLQAINRNVDLLFLVDDSSSMKNSQDNLRRNFPRFMTRLQDPPGLPNLHVAVISSDMGTNSGAACDPSTNKKGIFQYTSPPPRPGEAPCVTNLNPDARYISDSDGVRNYSGAIEDVFSCIAALGDGGCGFEHQFAAITRALGVDGRGAAPQENQGFLRKDAYLGVILITNEDDCSASPDVPLFDESRNNLIGDQLGPRTNFRCNEFGHLCNDGTGKFVHPNRRAPNDDVTAMVSYSECRSNEEEPYLLGVADTANRIKSLKNDPGQVLVAAITGPATPYTVRWNPPKVSDTSCGAASCPWPEIANSCKATDGSYADPSVRIVEFVNQFGANGLVLPICEDDFGPSLDRIAQLINESLKPPCITQTVATDPATGDFDCTVVSHTSDGPDAKVPACSQNGNVAPCWSLGPVDACPTGGTGRIVDISAVPGAPPSTARNATVNCSLCDPMFPDAKRGCP